MKIDLVYLWVDGNAPQWKKQHDSYLPLAQQQDAQSFCEGRIANNNELRYSLRSVDLYAPWINNIYIVTNNQTPHWLNTEHPKIHMVDHRDILPPEYLPMFNPFAVELGITNIKGLSEHFIYANDDMMFGKPTPESFFFTPEGKPISRFVRIPPQQYQCYKSKEDKYNYLLYKAAQQISKDYNINFEGCIDDHHITAYTKSIVNDCLEKYKDWKELTLSHRFRDYQDMERFIFELFAIAAHQAPIPSRSRFTQRCKTALSRLGLLPGPQTCFFILKDPNILQTIQTCKPHLLCFNDGAHSCNEDRERLKETLQTLYPKPSPFEKV